MEQMAETGLAAIVQLGGGLDAPNTLNHHLMLVLPGQHISKSNPQRKPQTKSKYWIGHIALVLSFRFDSNSTA